jgi:hypothetical protein
MQIPIFLNKEKLMATPKFNIILDMDGVIVNTTDKWRDKLLKDPRIIRHLDTIKNSTAPDIYTKVKNKHSELRIEYYMQDWFEISKDNKELHQIVNDTYFKDDKFYDDLEPTRYLNSLFKMTELIESIIIITHCGSDDKLPVNMSKKRWLIKYLKEFKNKDINIGTFLVPNNVLKSKIVIDNNINYSTFVDDNLECIRDMIENTVSLNREFLIPIYGYNKKFEQEGYYRMRYDCNIAYFDNLYLS